MVKYPTLGYEGNIHGIHIKTFFVAPFFVSFLLCFVFCVFALVGGDFFWLRDRVLGASRVNFSNSMIKTGVQRIFKEKSERA